MRKRKPNKAQHYQLSWNVFNAVEIVEQYEKQSGDTCLDAWAVANCLHKGSAAKTMTRRYKEAV